MYSGVSCSAHPCVRTLHCSHGSEHRAYALCSVHAVMPNGAIGWCLRHLGTNSMLMSGRAVFSVMFKLSALAETVFNYRKRRFPVFSFCQLSACQYQNQCILFEYFIFKIAVVSCLLEFYKKKCSMNFVLELGKSSHDL